MTLLRHGAPRRNHALRRVAVRAMFGCTIFAASTGANPVHASAATPAAPAAHVAQAH